jgi:hypothetical protein
LNPSSSARARCDYFTRRIENSSHALIFEIGVREMPKSCFNEGEQYMIGVGQQAPDFELASHLGGTKFTLSQFKGQKNVMLVFYPLDWTPT